MGWLCCGSDNSVIESKNQASRKSLAPSVKSITKTITNLTKPNNPPQKKLPPFKKFEPFIPENIPPRIEFSIRDSNVPLVDSAEFLYLLHEIIETNRNSDKPTILAQSDRRLGNVSKSDTVRKYIKNYGHEYDHIIWIDAENLTTMQNSLCNLSVLLNNNLLDEEGKAYKPIYTLAKEIFRVLTRQHCLIVYDSVDDEKVNDSISMEGITDFLPQPFPGQTKPSIIITSRKTRTHDFEISLEMAHLTEDKCVSYLLSASGAEYNFDNRAAAQKICDGLGRLPLLLKLAVTIIEREISREVTTTVSALSDFFEEYSSMKRRCLPLRMNDALSDSRYYTMIHLAMKKVLEHPDVKAREISRKCAQLMMYFHNIKIPTKIFSLFFPLENPAVLEQGLKLLSDYCVVTNCADYLEMHPMIQLAFLEVGKVNKWEGETIRSEIQILTSYLSNISSTEKYYREILACAIQVEDYVKDHYSNQYNLDFAKFLITKIRHIYFEKTFEISERVFKFENSALGSTHRDTVNSQKIMADALFDLKRFQEAEDAYLRVYIVRQEMGGKASKPALMTAYSLARVYSKQGLYRDALELYSESDLIAGNRKSNVMLDVMLNLQKYCEIAKLHLKVGEFEEARALASDVVDQYLRIEGLDTEETLKARYIKGRALQGLEEWLEADKELRIVVKLGSEMFGKAHVLVLIASRDLAQVRVSMGKVQEAYKILVELLEVQLKHFTLSHESTIIVMRKLGDVLLRLRRRDMAMCMFNQAMLFATAVLPQGHHLKELCESDLAKIFVKILPV